MFTSKCIMKGISPRTIGNLTQMGYALKGDIQSSPFLYFIAENGVAFASDDIQSISKDTYIDCGSNATLFEAICAMRDDSDLYQWFAFPVIKTIKLQGYFGQIVGMDGTQQIVDHIEYHLCFNSTLSERIQDAIACGEDPHLLPHKATIEELIQLLSTKDSTKYKNQH